MHVTRFNNAKPYDASGHDGMFCLRMQGKEASPAQSMWSSVMHILPGGASEMKASDQEKFYVVLSGTVAFLSGGGDEEILGQWDTCLFTRAEARRLENRGNLPATVCLVMSEVVV